MKMRLSDFILDKRAQLIGSDIAFEYLSTDSRAISKGDIFIALRGDHFDGHCFIEKAVALGACAVVVDVEQKNLAVPQLLVKDTLLAMGAIAAKKRQLFSGVVIAITGSSGKTTVKGMLASIFSAHASTLATQGNFNNQIGVPLTLMKMSDERYAVVELGTSFPGEIEYLTSLIDPDIALVTNVLPAHIGGFGSLDAIAKEKSRVYLAKHAKYSVINLDDPYAGYFIEQSQAKQCIGYRLTEVKTDAIAAVYSKNVSWSRQGKATFDLCFDGESVQVSLQVPGLHSMSNALAAAACALAAGCPLSHVVEPLNDFVGDKGRMQEKQGMNKSLVIDDTYNANPGSVKAAIDALAIRGGEKIFVLGDMGELGEAAEELHQDVGRFAKQKGIDRFYGCGELSNLSASAFGDGGYLFLQKTNLVDELKKQLQENTTVLVKGSRSAKMEDVVECLCSDPKEQAC